MMNTKFYLIYIWKAKLVNNLKVRHIIRLKSLRESAYTLVRLDGNLARV
jgi:hypothetical protein